MPDGIGLISDVRTIRHGHLFCGLGGGARGFNRAMPRIPGLAGQMECIGGIDVDPAAIRDFNKLSGVKGTVCDLFTQEQYTAFHGKKPPIGWREATPADIHKAFAYKKPHIVFTSSPCKGLSGLLSEAKSKSVKYQALNELTLRGVWLIVEAYKDDPVELILFENVPRIATRGRRLLDQIVALLRAYGYEVAETTHDCGEIGGLAQSRKRFLLVARHREKVPPCLYEPPKRPLRGVGEVLSKLPQPGDVLRGGPMHRVPALQWNTWVRLAFVEAGSDWRSLNKLAVENGHLRDYLIVPEMHAGTLGVKRWDEPSCTIAGRSSPSNNAYAVADARMPRGEAWKDGHAYGVLGLDQPSGTIAGQQSPGQGRYAVADPAPHNNRQFDNSYKIVGWDKHAGTVIGRQQPSDGALCVADPQHKGDPKFNNCYRIVGWDAVSRTVTGASGSGQCVADPRTELRGGGIGVLNWNHHAGTVAGESLPSNGTFSVADPRPAGLTRGKGDPYLSAGHYGVVPWNEASGAVSAAACHDNGKWAVADPRLPALTDRLVCRIQALDGTWHRPFTTLELAALQSLVDPDNLFGFDGESDQSHRERIGNAVPSDAAQAIAETMGRTLLLAWSGEKFFLSNVPIWVQPVAVALSVSQPELPS